MNGANMKFIKVVSTLYLLFLNSKSNKLHFSTKITTYKTTIIPLTPGGVKFGTPF